MNYPENYIVVIEGKNDSDVIISGKKVRLYKNDPDYDKAISIAKKAATEKNVDKRNDLVQQFVEIVYKDGKYLDMNVLLENVTNKDFVFDVYGRMFMKDNDGKVLDEQIPKLLAEEIIKYIKEGRDISPLKNFWKRLLINPSRDIRIRLFDFLESNGMVITNKGYFVAFKGVYVKKEFDEKTGEQIVPEKKYDKNTGKPIESVKFTNKLTYMPTYNGKYGTEIKIGKPVSMPRSEVVEDGNITCAPGLHVGALDYVKMYIGDGPDVAILEVLVDPANVVSVPYDYDNKKMRVSEYYPYAVYNGENIDKIYDDSDYESNFTNYTETDIYMDMERKKAEIERKLKLMKEMSKNGVV